MTAEVSVGSMQSDLVPAPVIVSDAIYDKKYWLEREKDADQRLKRICGAEYRSRLIRSELIRMRGFDTFLKQNQIQMSQRQFFLETLRLAGNHQAEDWTRTLSPERLAAREFVIARHMSCLVVGVVGDDNALASRAAKTGKRTVADKKSKN